MTWHFYYCHDMPIAANDRSPICKKKREARDMHIWMIFVLYNMFFS